MKYRLAVLLAAGLLVGGCGAETGSAPSSRPEVSEAPTATVEVALPVRLVIPKIELDTPLVEIGLDAEGVIDAENLPTLDAAWYTGGPRPGEDGPAVLVGHVDGPIDGVRGRPGVFNRVAGLATGDALTVRRADGTSVSFVVYDTLDVDKDEFPTDRVYGPVPVPELRLITCGGEFNRSTGHYEDNRVVFLRETEPEGSVG